MYMYVAVVAHIWWHESQDEEEAPLENAKSSYQSLHLKDLQNRDVLGFLNLNKSQIKLEGDAQNFLNSLWVKTPLISFL